MANTKKKKILGIAVSLILALFMFCGVTIMSACGNKDDGGNTDTGTNNQNEGAGPGFVDPGTDDMESSDDESSYTPESGTGKTYYVSADAEEGTSEWCDGTYEYPYNILDLVGSGSSGNHSNSSVLEPGDTVLVIPGRYDLTKCVYVEKSGTYDDYITIMNAAFAGDGHKYDDSVCTLCFYAMSFDGNSRGVTINSDYIYWYGIDVAGAGDNGMYIGGNHNVIENSQFYNNRDTGLQLGRSSSSSTNVSEWPSYNLIKNCTSFNNYDNETYGENADGFGVKLTTGYGNIFDGCIAYRNSDDGWDIYAKEDTGAIGGVSLYNCVSFENGYLLNTQAECNARFTTFGSSYAESDTNSYTTRDGEGNGFKLGGGSGENTDVELYNCMSFNNRMYGVTDDSNPGTISLDGVTAYNNCASIDNVSPSDTFGEISYDGNAGNEECSNICLARWPYSYNTFANVLSIVDGNSKTVGDTYRGSVTDSAFSAGGSKGYYVDGSLDADNVSDYGKTGTAYNAISASSTFVSLPATDLGVSTSFDADGVVDAGNIHVEMRNSDGSINAGGILTAKTGSGLPVRANWADLSLESWDEYSHPAYSVGSGEISAEEYELMSVANTLYVPVYEGAVYQDFRVVDLVGGYDVTWVSSDTSVLSVSEDDVMYTLSLSRTIGMTVVRDEKEDKIVTLSACVGTESMKYERKFNLTVKKDTPSIGDISVEGVSDGVMYVGQGSEFIEPAITVLNAADYSGKVLDESLYTVKETYEYAESNAATFDAVDKIDTSVVGAYRVTLDLSIDNPDENATVVQKTYTYYLYVVSDNSAVTFVDGMSLSVYRDGFELTGTLSSPSGYAYVLCADTALTGSGSDGKVLPADVTSNVGTSKIEFLGPTLDLCYANDNNSEYYVYCVLSSHVGTIFSEVYEVDVAVSHISTTDGFINMLSGNTSSTIYVLDNDINFSGVTYAPGNTTFMGLLNGMGYTVSNITTTERAVFDTVVGGTIENIKFDNISIDYTAAGTGESYSAGLIGTVRGGYLYNIAATNVSVVSDGQRVGGIMGQIDVVSGGNANSTYIGLVSLVNEYTHGLYTTDGNGNVSENYTGAIIKGAEAVGGIVGFIQADAVDSWNVVYIYDCYVNAYITSSGGIVGGIVGSSDDRNEMDYLSIESCHVYSLVESTSTTRAYIGGVIGQFTGKGCTEIYGCTSYGELWYGNKSLSVSLKNASWIVGSFAVNGNITVSNCFASCEEYNEEYGVSTYLVVSNQSSWNRYSPHDMQSGIWQYVYVDSYSNTLKAPYIELVFQEI